MKRLFDISLAVLLLVLTAPIVLSVIVVIALRDGLPVFYVSERMKTPTQAFRLIKFRTMTLAPIDENSGVTGGDKSARVTAVGKWLRRYRLDELPQLINILKGDMSFVGPRPPLRQYAQSHPIVYKAVLRSRPGVTGLATLHFHRHEERLIANAKTAAETEFIYVTRCIPRKAKLDLIYQEHASVCFDAKILLQTFREVFAR